MGKRMVCVVGSGERVSDIINSRDIRHIRIYVGILDDGKDCWVLTTGTITKGYEYLGDWMSDNSILYENIEQIGIKLDPITLKTMILLNT